MTEWEWISKEQALLATPLKGHSVWYSSPPFLPSLLYIISWLLSLFQSLLLVSSHYFLTPSISLLRLLPCFLFDLSFDNSILLVS